MQSLPPRPFDIPVAAPVAAPAAAQPPAGEVLAQLGAWRTRGKAEETLRAAHAAAAQPPPPIRVVAARVRGAAWWRVVAGPMRPDEARAFCLRLSPATPCWIRTLRSGAGRESP